ncbi:MAG: hypothetical protein NT066_06360, partial [Candidatus Omnitrophica bacterium]|nr:hypothetical protein [Candidatus Omnitrophota bacterium]
TLAITKGRLSAVVARVNKQVTFQVQTPTSVCGVRGTFMEVVVNPPAAAQGAPVGEQAQPATQVFFEGGRGYVTSTLTGQTQEIGSGQNAIVDALGNVAAPEYTAPEQRSAMFQVWTSAQTMNSYSTAEGATGVGSNTQQEPLPQAPVGPILGGEDIVKTFVDIPPDIGGDPGFKEPINLTIYDQTLPFYGYVGHDAITGGSIAVSAFDKHTWSAITSGTFQNYPGPGSDIIITFRSGSDEMVVTVTGAPDYGGVEVCEWSGTVSGSIGSITPAVSISGDMSGTYTYTGVGEGYGAGTFEGSGSGTSYTVE